MTQFKFSHDALSSIEETGCDPDADLQALVTGTQTPAGLWAHCVDGADDDRLDGWKDYFSEVIIAYEAATGADVDVDAIYEAHDS